MSTAPLRVHVQRHHARVAFHPRQMIAERAIGVMLEIAVERADRAVDARVLVDLAIAAPAAAAPVEKAQHAIGIRVAVAQVRTEIFGRAREAIAGVARKSAVALALDLIAQLRRHALVGVEAEDPVVRGHANREIFLRAVAVELPYE